MKAIFVQACSLVYCAAFEMLFRLKWLGQDLIAKSIGFENHAAYMQHLLDIRARIRENRFE